MLLHNKNFLLICVSGMFQRMVFWYSIYIAFAYSINLTLEEIALAVVATNLGVMLFEIPFGALADRWSRKWTLMIGLGLLFISGILKAISTEPNLYIFSSFMWGIFFALQSGIPEALIYDMLKQEHKTYQYRKYLGTFRIIGTVGLITGAVGGGVLAALYSLQTVFFLSLIPVACAMLSLLFITETSEHHANQATSKKDHYVMAYKQLVQTKAFLYIVIASVIAAASVNFILELSQVYYYAAGIPIALYGIFKSVMNFAEGGGTWLAQYAKGSRVLFVTLLLAITLSIAVILDASAITGMILAAIMLIVYFVITVLEQQIQDTVTSQVRVAANSMISTAGRIVFTIGIVIFGVINSSKQDVNGFILLTIALVLTTVFLYMSLPKKLATLNS